MNPYFEQKIRNADPIDLIGIVYQHAVSCVRGAREHLRLKRIAERSAAIMRAYSAVAELIAALRPEEAPELSGRLQSLYFHVQQRLLDANTQQTDQPLAEVLGVLITLEEAWSGVAAQLASGKEAPAGSREATGEAETRGWRHAEPGNEDTARLAVSA